MMIPIKLIELKLLVISRRKVGDKVHTFPMQIPIPLHLVVHLLQIHISTFVSCICSVLASCGRNVL